MIILLSMPLIIIALFINYQKVYSTTYEIRYDNVYKEVIVREGDTLWKIALENMPPDYDVRKMVYEIKVINKIIDSNIYPGELIKVPIKHSPNK